MTRIASVTAPRGRPKDPAKREALLNAARDLFLSQGPDGVTVDEIAARAGVSKVTLYANFADRNALLEAVMARESERIISNDYLADTAGRDLEAALCGLGERVLGFLANPQMVGLERLIAVAAESHPEKARRFFEVGPGRNRDILVKLIEMGIEQGRIATDDPVEAASDLIGLWQGFLRLETIFRYRQPPGNAEIRRRAARGVELFMRLYGCTK
ncbi:TetR/AcrR family transcriptional regulator [Paraburkholderia sp. J12]|uniref:TetR/AcrR family transcriptional regulator n=1 Tax=Paraburkholderia sp. J12 TaxID=2805432 RepID=UPI002ABE8A89|nr:TetR/AcrR family transcriptional regulator [Paraburkholderia sp. J12]